MKSKVCRKCGVDRNEDMYQLHKKKNWRENICKACKAENDKRRIKRLPPEYRVWLGVRDRCKNPNTAIFKWYGGRGISVCKEWDSFEAFLGDMGSRPTGNHELDRIDNNQGYCKENCRWATKSENRQNTSHTVLTPEKVKAIRRDYSNGDHTYKTLAEKYEIAHQTVGDAVAGRTWVNVER